MRFAFTEDQVLIRDTFRELLAATCTLDHLRAVYERAVEAPGAGAEPGVGQRPGSASTPRVPELWGQMAEMWIVGLTAPERHGGLGLGSLDWVLLAEEAGYAALPEPFVETTIVSSPLLAGVGAAAPAGERWLPAVAEGRAVVTLGAIGGSPVPWADVADLLLLAVDGDLHAVEAAAVDPDAVERIPEPSVDATRRLAALRGTLGGGTLLLAGDDARAAVGAAEGRGALAAAAALLGVGRRLLDDTVEHAKVREQFGRPIGSFQAVQHQCADMARGLEFARPLVHRAAWSLAEGAPDGAVHVSMAKASASEAALGAARHALQVHGAIGYSYEHHLHIWLKRAWSLARSWGDAAHHRERVAQFVLDGESVPEAIEA